MLNPTFTPLVIVLHMISLSLDRNMMDVRASLHHITYTSVSVKMTHFAENSHTLGGSTLLTSQFIGTMFFLRSQFFVNSKIIFHILWNMKVRYRFGKRPSTVRIISQKNTFPILPLFFFKTLYDFISHKLVKRLKGIDILFAVY